MNLKESGETIDMKKQCRICGEIKPITGFYKNKSRKDGHMPYCTPCGREYYRKWREAKGLRKGTPLRHYIERGTRKCTICKVEKPIKSFYKNSSDPRGYSFTCKSCEPAYVKNYVQTIGRESHRKSAQKMYRRYRGTEEYKKYHVLAHKKYIARHPEKARAHVLAAKAHPVLLECEKCKARDVTLHRHHPDYSKPLEILVLCQPCHVEVHWEANQKKK